jgi:hypothetical protein
MYPKEYFMERFRNDETEELLQRYATADLADEAKETILSLLQSRGMEDAKLQPLVLQARKATPAQGRETLARLYFAHCLAGGVFHGESS